MFTRTIDCSVKPEFRDKFITSVHDEILPTVKKQPGFVDLMCLFSDERPEHALVLTFWKSKSEAEAFYQHAAPMLDILKPLSSNATIEHYGVEISSAFKIAFGKAA